MPVVKKKLKSKTNELFVEKDKNNKIVFKFSYLEESSCCKGQPELADNCVSEEYGSLKLIKSYEKNLFVEYWYLILKKAYNLFINNESDSLFTNIMPVFLQILDRKDSPFNEYKIFNSYSTKELCKEFTELPFIQKQLALNIEIKGYCCINSNVFYSYEKTIPILKKYIETILEEIKKYLDNLNFEQLESCFYTKQFNLYMDLLNLKKIEPKVYEFIKYLFYMRLRLFGYDLYQPLYYLDDLFPTISELKKYNGFLIRISNDRYKLKYVDLDSNFEALCFSEFKSENLFKDAILHKIEKTKLTSKAFEYVPEYNYIKSILMNASKQKTKGINILLYGEPGTGKTEMARVLVKELNLKGYEVSGLEKNYYDFLNLDASAKNVSFMTMKYILKNTNNSIILYDEAEDFFRKKYITDTTKSAINELLENNEIPVIWTTNDLNILEESYLRRFTYACNISFMSEKIYKKIFNDLCKEYKIKLTNEIFKLCFTEHVSIGILRKTLSNYKLSNSKNLNNLFEDIKNTIKSQKGGNYIYKTKLERPKKFDTKLLNTSDDLNTFCKKIKKIKRFDFSLLLYGVSGSGKSYYAEYLADQLHLPIIKKKASDLESCWVGQTEQNIAKAFNEALINKAILVIDEGDHFISERTNHNHSWETSRTEEMLQQIEMHPYPVIFTTNLIQNIDKAAMRRFTYKTKFDYLTKDQVKIAWKDYFPQAPLPKEIYLSRLCPGDFATVYKKAEFENYLSNTSLIYKKLEEEMKNKKEIEDLSIRI